MLFLFVLQFHGMNDEIKQSYKTVNWSDDIKRLSFIFKDNSELLELSTLKSSKETGWLHISIWSLAAVDFFYLDRFFVKADIPECSPTLTLT